MWNIELVKKEFIGNLYGLAGQLIVKNEFRPNKGIIVHNKYFIF